MTNPAPPLRVLVVSQYYPPEAHGSIPHAVAHGLSGLGHDVRVLTTFPNHPHGRVFAGWEQRFRHVEQEGAVTVRRVPVLPDHSGLAVRRALGYLSFTATSIAAGRLVRGADVVYVYCAQPTAAIGPEVWRRLFGVPYVLHVQDVWPESVTGSGILPGGPVGRAAGALLLAWLRRLHAGAAQVVAIAPGAARLLVERGADPTRTSTVLNWPTRTAAPRPHRDGDGRTRIVYAGNLGPNQGLETVVRAAASCRDLSGLEFVFIGSGLVSARLQALAGSLRASNIEFHEPVPQRRMGEVHAATDFAVIALADVPMSAVTIPSKLQDALAHGVPVVAMVPGDAAALVRDGDAGLVVAPGDVAGLAAAFRTAHATGAVERRRLSGNASAVVRRHMDPSSAIQRIELALRRAAQ